jgi:hypothetical protein
VADEPANALAEWIEVGRVEQQNTLAQCGISKKYWSVTSKRFGRMDWKQAEWASKTN